MKFSEFLNKTGMTFSGFCREIGLSRNTVESLYYKKSNKISLGVAMKIVEYSKGEVTFEDLYSEFQAFKRKGRAKKKNPE